jgi:hypothetical protein
MVIPATEMLVLTGVGSAMMFYVLLNAIGKSAMVLASETIVERRAMEKRRAADNEAAEAAGRAAAMEPLALNPDGTVEEPIIGVVEKAY